MVDICDKCGSSRVLNVMGKVSDQCTVAAPWLKLTHQGYVPKLPGLSDDDKYLCFAVCVDCASVQGVSLGSDETLRKRLKTAE